MIGLLVLLSGVAAADAVRVVNDAGYAGGQEYKSIFTKLAPGDPAFDRMAAFVSKR